MCFHIIHRTEISCGNPGDPVSVRDRWQYKMGMNASIPPTPDFSEDAEPPRREQVRDLPFNIEAEQALLGAILFNNKAYERVSDFLLPEHFYDPVHAHIYETSGELIRRGQIASPITLKSFFDQNPALKALEGGGAGYLARLAAATVSVYNAKDFGQTVYDLAVRRELIAIGDEMQEVAYDSPVDLSPADQIEQIEGQLFQLAEKGKVNSGFMKFDSASQKAIELAELAYKKPAGVSGIATGLTDIDDKLGGLQKSDLLIIAGRPGMGKTSLATNIAFHVAKNFRTETDEHSRDVTVDGGRVAFFSLEMSSEQLATRILSEQSRVSSSAIRKGTIDEDDFRRFARAVTDLQHIPLYIDETGGISIATLSSRARRLKRTAGGLDLIVVDYLQLATGAGRRSDNRVLEVGEITQGLKALAKELDVPVIALSQLSRAVEQRDDKRPNLSDLRESGSIEQDADVVMFVYREAYYVNNREPAEGTAEHDTWQQDMERVQGKAEVIIAKQRHGPVGKVELYFEERFTKFGNLDRHHTEDFGGFN